MKETSSFPNAINHYSLLFRRPNLERKFRELKDTEFKNTWPRCLMMLTTSFITTAFSFTINNDTKLPNQTRFYAGLSSILLLNGTVILELITHFFHCLRFIRGLFIVIGLSLGGSIYGAYVHASPAIQPGSIAAFILCIFVNLYFSYNWICSVVNQLVGQIAITTFLAVRYNQLLQSTEGFIPLLNINSSLIFLPLLFYFAERDKRQIAFLGWQRHKETQFWKHIVGELPAGVVIAHQGEVRYRNQYVSTLLEPTQHVGELVQRLKELVRHDQPRQILHDLLLNEEQFQEANGVQFVCANKEDLVLAVTLLKFRRADVDYKVCIMQDQRVMEELQQTRMKIQYQKDFFAMISHELRNPLHGVMGVLEVLQPALPSPELQKHCAVGFNTSKLMLSLINDILDLSQIETCKLTLANDWHNPTEAAHECLTIMLPQYERKKLFLRLQLPLPIPELYCDRRRYSQILINLLSNAAKFTHQGGVVVKMEYDIESLLLTTSVTDTGTGICAENIKKLFQPYGKVSDCKDNPQGVGLGLLICKKLSEQMGGSISVESEIGQGTTFRFAVKSQQKERDYMLVHVARQEYEQKQRQYDKKEVETPGAILNIAMERPAEQILNESYQGLLSSERIPSVQVLVIDDDYSSAHVLKLFCSSLHIAADSAVSGEEGLRFAEERLRTRDTHPYSLFFVDMCMPGINGLETAQHLRKLYASYGLPLTIIGLSGDANGELKSQCLGAGMQELIQKPFSRQDMLLLLHKCLSCV